ncbi:MAG TPA: MFS transporter, partial [Candidatus Sulfotelmatobacter sp.]|nr:MFS transporter [Candidatus Sulfotelmatobacter sp.]
MSTAAIVPNDVDRRARRRISLRLLPFVLFMYVIAYLDRNNLATAALQMPHDLGFDYRVIGFGAGIFSLGYVILEIPGTIIVERWSARKWLMRIMVSWGFVTMAMAFIRTPHQFYTMRFLLGLAEAGFFPGIIVYLTHWFLYEDRAKAVAFFMAAIPLSFAVGSPVSGLLLGVHWFGLRGWQWLFILEGMPAVFLGVTTVFYLTDWPHQAKWMPEDERKWMMDQLEKEKKAKQSVHSYTVWEAMRHRDVVILTALHFVQNGSAYALAFWLPTMLKELSRVSDFKVTLMVALPNLLGFAAMQINGWHSDRTGERRWHTAIPLWVTAAALLVISTLKLGTVPSLVFFSIAAAGLLAFLPSFWAMPSAFLCDSAAAVATGTINCVAAGLGGFLGPALVGYQAARTHSFRSGFGALVVALLISGILPLTLRVRAPFPKTQLREIPDL